MTSPTGQTASGGREYDGPCSSVTAGGVRYAGGQDGLSVTIGPPFF